MFAWSCMTWLWSTVGLACYKQTLGAFQPSRLTWVRLWAVVTRREREEGGRSWIRTGWLRRCYRAQTAKRRPCSVSTRDRGGRWIAYCVALTRCCSCCICLHQLMPRSCYMPHVASLLRETLADHPSVCLSTSRPYSIRRTRSHDCGWFRSISSGSCAFLFAF